MKLVLTKAGKEELGLAILLWKDFKCQGKLDVEITKQAIGFAKMLDVEQEYEEMLLKIPPMKIIKR